MNLNFDKPKTALINGNGSSWLSMILASAIGSEKSLNIGTWQPLAQPIPCRYIYTTPAPKKLYRPPIRDGLHGKYPPQEIIPAFHCSLSVPEKLNALFKGANIGAPRLTITDYFNLGTTVPTWENSAEKMPLNLSLSTPSPSFLVIKSTFYI